MPPRTATDGTVRGTHKLLSGFERKNGIYYKKDSRWNNIKIIDFSIRAVTLINSNNINSYVMTKKPKFGTISFNKKFIYKILMHQVVFCESLSFL